MEGADRWVGEAHNNGLLTAAAVCCVGDTILLNIICNSLSDGETSFVIFVTVMA